MKHYSILFAVLVWSLVTFDGSAQGTAFTYQGRLNEGVTPATGAYDFQFAIYDSATDAGGIVAGPVTHSAIAVNNGLFTATLDFGANVFNGANRWLEIGVRARGGTFATLSPRQAITPVPYAAYAMTPAGPQGPNGLQGSPGAAGPKGDKGDTGSAGPRGDKGDTGLAGPKGDSGLAGSAGPKGDKGDTGSAGPAGVTGAQGPTGPSGVAGPKGDKGDAGFAGSAGPKGDKGDKGDIGLTGAAGPQGIQGLIGPPGPEGPLSPNVALRVGFNNFSDAQFFNGGIRLDSPFGFNQSSLGEFSIDALNKPGERFVVKVDGKVGVGTAEPTSRFHSVAILGNGVQGNSSDPGGSGVYGENNGQGYGVAGRTTGAGTAVLGDNPDPNGWAGYFNGRVRVGVLTVAGGDLAIAAPGSLNFGAQSRQMLNLFGTECGIGVQEGNTYFRTSGGFTDGAFHWYKGGTHSSTGGDGGGGTELMSLDGIGNLDIHGAFGSLSDRNAKQDFEPVNEREVLEKVAALPLVKWSFKTDASTRHIGPMAQDFYAAFHVGADDKHIATVDADGVALAAIQGLNQKVDERDAKIAELEKRLSKLEQLISDRIGGDQ